MPKLSDEQVAKNAEIIGKLIKTFPANLRESVEAMFEQIGEEFFLAPASMREDYHGAFPGGLADHSLRVVLQLRKIAEALAPGKYKREDLDFLGLVHDLGKVGMSGKPLYVPNPNEWGRKRGFIYEINKEIPYMPISDRTMYLLQYHGIPLTPDEFLAIRLSDGQYEEGNRRYGMKEPDLALLLHFADRWACALEKSP